MMRVSTSKPENQGDYDLGWSRGYKVGADSNKATASVRRQLSATKNRLAKAAEAVALLERHLRHAGFLDLAKEARDVLNMLRGKRAP